MRIKCLYLSLSKDQDHNYDDDQQQQQAYAHSVVLLFFFIQTKVCFRHVLHQHGSPIKSRSSKPRGEVGFDVWLSVEPERHADRGRLRYT
jgi:hypothetical protein